MARMTRKRQRRGRHRLWAGALATACILAFVVLAVEVGIDTPRRRPAPAPPLAAAAEPAALVVQPVQVGDAAGSAPAPAPATADDDPLGQLMAEKHLTVNGRPIRSRDELARATGRLHSTAPGDLPDEDPIVLSFDVAGHPYVVPRSTWRTAVAVARRYGRSPWDVIGAQVAYESLVQSGLYPSQAAAIVMGNTGLPIMPSGDQLAAETMAKHSAAQAHARALERTYGR